MLETIRTSPAGLYRQLLNASWDDLGEAVRRLHGDGETIRAAGTFRVRHGHGRLARWLVRLAGLPAESEAVEVRLVITRRDSGEEWSRAFAGRPLVSLQWQRPGGLLAERMGLLVIRFRLEVTGGALIYHSQGAALRLGPLGIPLPRWCSPHISAWEKPAGGEEHIQVAVEVRLPFLGLLLAYEGTLTSIEVQG
jgi:hypothetical protein